MASLGKMAPAQSLQTDPPKQREGNVANDDLAVYTEIKSSISLLEKGLSSFEARYAARVLRSTKQFRHRLTPKALRTAVQQHMHPDLSLRKDILKILDDSTMDTSTLDGYIDQDGFDRQKYPPETDIYIGLLLLLHFHDQKDIEHGLTLSSILVNSVQALKQRSLDFLTSRIYFYYSQFHEMAGCLAKIRPVLLSASHSATLRHHPNTQAVLLNLMLRNYLHYNLYDQADKLISKAIVPEFSSNSQMARYMYYIGCIKAVQLDYTVAHNHLLQAIRKTPQSKASAGFQQEVYKLLIVLELLMGSIPERSIFRQAILRKSLAPYLEITRAVRVGDLARFKEALNAHSQVFLKDKTYTLIYRLHHNVIKTAIRMISLAYTRISLKDIFLKLQLDSEEDAEYIVAKAIGDGVITATIDHGNGYMECKDVDNVYATNEPLAAYDKRIRFCMELHNGSIKALRFPSETHSNDLESVVALREEERKIAQVIAEGDLDDEDDIDAEW